MSVIHPADRLIVALDVPTLDEALALIRILRGTVNWFKVGLSLFMRVGLAGVRRMKEEGIMLFLDLKFHDIPAVVEEACRGAADLGADMLTVHTAGGIEMLRRAVEGVHEQSSMRGGIAPIVLGVTVLTSLDLTDLQAQGYPGTVEERVRSLATLARTARLDGVVSSAREVSMLRAHLGLGMILVTPGIRPSGGELGDQKRVVTPREAILAGSDHIVVGRPIIASPDPVAAARAVAAEVAFLP